jgi:hypothetical protein
VFNSACGSGRAGLTKLEGTGPETMRTGRTGRFPTGSNSKFEFEFKKMKNSQKILRNTLRCVEFNGVKNFQIFIHLAYFAGIISSTKKEK